MSIQMQYRRGSAVQMASFIGASGEVMVDQTYSRTVLHDGVTPGGFPMERCYLTKVLDSNYSALPTDVVIMYTALTAARQVRLPSALQYPSAQRLWIIDGTGNAGSFNITVVPSSTVTSTAQTPGSTEHMFNGSGSGTSFVINTAFGHVVLVSNQGLTGASAFSTANWATC